MIMNVMHLPSSQGAYLQSSKQVFITTLAKQFSAWSVVTGVIFVDPALHTSDMVALYAHPVVSGIHHTTCPLNHFFLRIHFI